MANNKKAEARESRQETKAIIREYTEAIIIALLLALLIRTFIVQAFKIPSGSMEKTLLIGDHILVNKFSYGVHIPNEIPFTTIKIFSDFRLFAKTPERHDIIVFKYPRDEERDFIKRVVGLPGEKLEIRRQKIYINDQLLPDQPYINHQEPPADDDYPPRDDFGPVIIPEKYLFVMGDNRENSQDSRYWGFLNEENIKGKAVVIYWSWNGDQNWVRFERFAKTLH